MTQQAIDEKNEKKKPKAANETKGAIENSPPTEVVESAADGFTDYVIDRPSFDPELFLQRDEKNPKIELYTGKPVQGLWFQHCSLGKVVDNQTGKLRDMMAYLVQLTAPAICSDRDGNRVNAKVKDTILVWETAQLLQALPPEVANHPQFVVHMRMLPEYRGPHPKQPQQRMWRTKFQLAANAKVPRSQVTEGAAVIAQLLATAPKAPSAYDRVLAEHSQPSEGGLPF